MRLTILAVFLWVGNTAFCQSTAPAPLIPDNLRQTLPAVTPPARDFSKLPPGWHMTDVAPLSPPKILLQQNVSVARGWDDAQMDPKIIVHPPQSSIGVQPPGTPVAQNEYPNLKKLPIASAGLKPQAIPTQLFMHSGTRMAQSPAK